jgi:hypothetical protein
VDSKIPQLRHNSGDLLSFLIHQTDTTLLLSFDYFDHYSWSVSHTLSCYRSAAVLPVSVLATAQEYGIGNIAAST